MRAVAFKEELVSILSECDNIKAIGQTGEINAPLISGNSDIDLFVLCTTVPSEEE